MLAKELYKELESKITEENRKLIKEYFDLIKTKRDTNKVFFSIKELNEVFNNKFEEGAYNNFYIKNGGFNIAFFPYVKQVEEPHFLIEETLGDTKYRTIVTEKFTKTSSLSKEVNSGFKEQIGFTNRQKEDSTQVKINEILNLNIGDFVIDLVHSKDKKYTNKEIQDLVNITYPESKASQEIISVFVKHQAKLKDIINNTVENKAKQKPTM